MGLRPGFHFTRHLIGVLCILGAWAVLHCAKDGIVFLLTAVGLSKELFYLLFMLAPVLLGQFSMLAPLLVVRSRMRRKGYDGFGLERASEYYRHEGMNTECVPHFLDVAAIPGIDVDRVILSIIELARLRRVLQKNEWRK